LVEHVDGHLELIFWDQELDFLPTKVRPNDLPLISEPASLIS